jgi:hypothetical protein
MKNFGYLLKKMAKNQYKEKSYDMRVVNIKTRIKIQVIQDNIYL